MRYRHSRTAMRSRYLVKPAVSQLAGSHLNTLLMDFGIFLCIKSVHTQLHTHLLRQSSYKLLIPFRLLAAKLKVAMCHHAFVAATLQYIQQSHAIRTSAHAYQHTVARA